MNVTRIVGGVFDVDVYCPYALRCVVKTIPGKRWDPARHVWTIPRSFALELMSALRAAGCQATATNQDGTPWGVLAAPPARTTTSWAVDLLEAVGRQRVDGTVRALSKVLHPDVAGGDAVLMRDLNDVRNALTRAG